MSYNILGVNLSHNGSICVLKDGKIDFFLEEDRITKKKHDCIPIKLLDYASKNFDIHEVALSGLYHYPFPSFSEELYDVILDKFFPSIPKTYYLENHHLTHAFHSFSNSNFSKCLSIVIDGTGTSSFPENEGPKFETESIYELSYNTSPKPIYKSYRTNGGNEDLLSFSKVYEYITSFLGFGFLEAGKTMGLSSYGKYNPNLLPLYIGTKGNPKVFDVFLNSIDGKLNSLFLKNLNLNSISPEDLAYHVQFESQRELGNLIEKYINQTGIKNICCAGGYFLNCVTNYYLTKRFPDVKFYFEPLSGEAGVSIGASRLLFYQKTKNTTIPPQKTLYYGPEYSKEKMLKGIKKFL